MSDRIAVMNKGAHRAARRAARSSISRPASLFALQLRRPVDADRRHGASAAEDGMVAVETTVGRCRRSATFSAGSPVIVAVRPEQLRVSAQHGEANCGRRPRPLASCSRARGPLVEFDAGAGESLLAETRPGATARCPRVHDEIRLALAGGRDASRFRSEARHDRRRRFQRRWPRLRSTASGCRVGFVLPSVADLCRRVRAAAGCCCSVSASSTPDGLTLRPITGACSARRIISA